MSKAASPRYFALRRWFLRVAPFIVFGLSAGFTFLLWRDANVGAEARDDLALPLLGVLISFILSLLTFFLCRQIDLYRTSRDLAISETTEREKAQDELRASEHRYRSIFDSTTDGLLLIDQDDCIIEANPAAAAMHGYRLEELTGRYYEKLLAPDNRSLYREFKRRIEQFGSVRLDTVHRVKDGGQLQVEERGAKFSYGKEPRMLAILTDVSDRKRAVLRHEMLSRKVLMAQEEERARVSRDLHDELGQILTALHLEIDMLRKKARAKPEELADAFGNAVAMVEKAAEEMRHLCRGLRPPLLDDLGIEPAIRLLVKEFEERTKMITGIEIQLDEEKPITSEVALCIYRIVQESLNNISRHADATEAHVSLIDKGSELVLSIYDNGRGFDVNDTKTIKGYGIAGMHERAFLVNGTVDVRSEPSKGVRVVFRVPWVQRPETELNDNENSNS